MRLLILAFQEIEGGVVGIKLTEADYEGEPSTERERRNAHTMAESLASLLDAVESASTMGLGVH